MMPAVRAIGGPAGRIIVLRPISSSINRSFLEPYFFFFGLLFCFQCGMADSFPLPVPIPPDSSLSEKEREHIERELSLN